MAREPMCFVGATKQHEGIWEPVGRAYYDCEGCGVTVSFGALMAKEFGDITPEDTVLCLKCDGARDRSDSILMPPTEDQLKVLAEIWGMSMDATRLEVLKLLDDIKSDE